ATALATIGDTLFVAGVKNTEYPLNGVWRFTPHEAPVRIGSTGNYARVWAMATAPGRLAIGGDFARVGGVLSPGVAMWSASGWRSLGRAGAGVGGRVSSFTEYKGSLVAGGYFGDAGSVAARNVARWNGSGWDSLGAGIPDFP